MSNRLLNLFAGILLLAMFLLAVFSIRDDTFTFDETSHVASGYSYLTQKDYRLNPEHPPLIKDLAALPLLFLNLNFPKDDPNWLQETPPPWWTQFDFATAFLYHSGNNPDRILFWSRLMMILLLVFLGWLLFYFAKKLFGQKTALLALFFFCFSPTLLAHGRLITTDLGAALGALLAVYFWLKFLKNPTGKNIFLAGIIFGIAMLLKFSLITLIPFFGLITIIYAWFFAQQKPLTSVLKYLGKAILIGIIGVVAVIWPVYFYHTLNYPVSQQLRDTQYLLSTTSVPQFLAKIDVALVKNPITRPLAHYVLGVMLAVNRTETGNTAFFLGQISAASWKTYFPVVYSIKEPLAFLILLVISLCYMAWLINPSLKFTGGRQQPWQRFKNWTKSHFTEFSFLCFVAIYWLTSLATKLNIGIRHLMPVFPFTIILVAYVLSLILKPPRLKTKYVILGGFLLWQVVSVVSIYPHFLAYFNELAGGPNNGYLYAVDSNLDWGQDLKRLKNWLDDNQIDKIYLDYFGGGNTEYYLKEKFVPWSGTMNPQELPKNSYLAVSASQLQGGRSIAVKGYDGPTGYYNWLNAYTPLAKIGYSIFVYKVR
jgi:4-amino-4-deoxy-L-arabinose transferase-like glycosyltransferase